MRCVAEAATPDWANYSAFPAYRLPAREHSAPPWCLTWRLPKSNDGNGSGRSSSRIARSLRCVSSRESEWLDVFGYTEVKSTWTYSKRQTTAVLAFPSWIAAFVSYRYSLLTLPGGRAASAPTVATCLRGANLRSGRDAATGSVHARRLCASNSALTTPSSALVRDGWIGSIRDCVRI
jgi:hypothetical protein